MTLVLSNVEFISDFFSCSMPDGSVLVLNKISEDFLFEGKETVIKHINILIQPVDNDENILCSSVIGMGNSYLMLKTAYEEHLGETLNEDNMKYCTIEIYEETQ